MESFHGGVGIDALHHLLSHQLTCHQLQCPTGSALRKLGAGQGYQMGLSLDVQPFRAAIDLLPALQGSLRTLLTQRRRTRPTVALPAFENLGYLLIIHRTVSLDLIAEQQKAGMRLFVSSRPALGHHRSQFPLLLPC